MDNLIANSAYFGVTISIAAYWIGMVLKRKWKLAVFNPLLISVILIMAGLKLFHIDYTTYYDSGKFLSYLLTPATVCLAIPLYEQYELLKKNWKAVILGIFAGVLGSLGSILVMSFLFGLNHQEYVTLLPKSITTAIGMGVSEELGGYVTITVVVIVVTGILGNVMAEFLCKLFHIKDPVAVGVAIGTSSHAIGTAKANEIGDVEGAMSGLAIAVAGLMTVAVAPIFAGLL